VLVRFRQPWDKVAELLVNTELNQSVGSLHSEKFLGSDSKKAKGNPYWWR